jgi:Ras-related protein Rab-5C
LLTDRRKISTEDAKKYAQEKGMAYIETSAKNFSNVSESFISCAKMILAKINNKQIDPKNEVSPMIKI